MVDRIPSRPPSSPPLQGAGAPPRAARPDAAQPKAPAAKPPPASAPPAVERGSSSLTGKQIALLKSLPRQPLIPTSSPRVFPGPMPPIVLGAAVDTPSLSSAAHSAERERTFALVDTLRQAGFPGMKFLNEGLPVRTSLTPDFAQAGVKGEYSPGQIRLSEGDHPLIAAVSPGRADSYSQGGTAVGTFYHEAIHHQQESLVKAPWFRAMEKHYEGLIARVKEQGKYTPFGSSATLAHKFTFEAFAKYAGERADVWMTAKAGLMLAVEQYKDPDELRKVLKNHKASYEANVQKKGESFGYINEFPSPWKPEFPLPSGPERAKIDEATGIPGSFEKAFPEYARLLDEAPSGEAKP